MAPWPEPRHEEGWEDDKVADFILIQEIVRAVRNIRAEKAVQPGQRIAAALVSAEKGPLLKGEIRVLTHLARLDPEKTVITDSLPGKPEGHVGLVVGSVEVYLQLAGLANPQEERARLERELAEAQTQIERLKKLLGGPFAAKAPPDVVEKERARLAGFTETAEKIISQIEALKN